MKTRITVKNIFLLVLGICMSIAAYTQDTYLMNSSNHNRTISTCDAILYDSGGASGSYSSYEDYTLTFCSPNGASFDIAITQFDTESCCDYLSIYNGPNASSPVLLNQGAGTTPQGNTYTTTGSCVTFVFHSDHSITKAGFAINLTCNITCQDYTIAPTVGSPSFIENIHAGTELSFGAIGTYPDAGLYYPQSDANVNWTWRVNGPLGPEMFGGLGINSFDYIFSEAGTYTVSLRATDDFGCVVDLGTNWIINVTDEFILSPEVDNNTYYLCSGNLYDSGGASGHYGNNEDYTVTFCSSFAGAKIQLDFSRFSVVSGDYLTILEDGVVIIDRLSGGVSPGLITASTEDACLTVVWHSNNTGTAAGFAAEISCDRLSCDVQPFSVAITSTNPSLPDPVSIILEGTTVTFNASGIYPGSGTEYLQTNANVRWRWIISNGITSDVLGGVGATSINYTFSAPGNYTVTLVATDINGCEATTSPINITVPSTIRLNNQTTGQTINSCDLILYDSGGPNGEYSDNESYNITICSGITGATLNLDIINFNAESTSYDYMILYDGNNSTSTALTGRISGRPAPEVGNRYTSTGECMHLTWRSDGSQTFDGFELKFSCNIPCQDYNIDFTSIDPPLISPAEINVNNNMEFTASGTYPNNDINYDQSDSNIDWKWTVSGPTVTILQGTGMNQIDYNFVHPGSYTISLTATDSNGCTASVEDWLLNVLPNYFIDDDYDGTTISACGGTIYDSGGETGNYSDNENYEVTLCSDFPGSRLVLDFISIDLAANDQITIYDGIGTGGSLLLQPTSGTILPSQITAPNECVTFTFVSDGSTTGGGFAIDISCTPPSCQDFEVEIASTTPSLPSQNYVVTLGTTVSFTGRGIYNNPNPTDPYPQSDATTHWRWEFINGGTQVIEGIGSTTVDYVFNTPGEYEIIIIATDENGCESTSESIIVTVPETYNLDQSLTGQTITTCSATLYDSGGPDGDYDDYEDYNITFCSPRPDMTLRVEILEFESESTSYDYMYIYDDGNPIAGPIGGRSPSERGNVYETTGQCVYITWKTDVSSVYSGFKINILCNNPCQPFSIDITGTNPAISNGDEVYVDTHIDFTANGIYPESGDFYDQNDSNINWQWEIITPGNTETQGGIGNNTLSYDFTQAGLYIIRLTGEDSNGCTATASEWYVNVLPVFNMDDNLPSRINSCNGTIYDSGGINGNYGNNENREVTICGDFPSSRPRLTFTSLSLSPNDYISIYEGIGTSGTVLLPPTSGTSLPGIIEAGEDEECLTIVFVSNGSGTSSGYAIDIECIPPECQDFYIDSLRTEPVLGEVIDIGRYSSLEINAFGLYENDTIYPQSDATSTWTWIISDGSRYSGIGRNSMTHTFSAEGTYTINLIVTDENGCDTEVFWDVYVNPSIFLDDNTSGSTITSCNLTIFDSGGPNGNYRNNEDYHIIVCSGEENTYLSVDILDLATESSTSDYLSIYEYENNSVGRLILARVGGSGLTTTHYESDSECIYISWKSDNRNVDRGFELLVECKTPCQPFNIYFEGYDPNDTSFIDICVNDSLSFTANAQFFNNDENYHQSIENLMWTWKIFTDGEFLDTSDYGLTDVSYQFTKHQGYYVYLTAKDENNCIAATSNPKRVRVSLKPDFSGTSITPFVCPGEPFDMRGRYSIEPFLWEIPDIIDSTACIDGGSLYAEQRYYFRHSAFAPGDTISSIFDIDTISITLEHSYIGDLDIILECPADRNGYSRRMYLKNYDDDDCNGTYLGVPIDVESRPCEIGEPWTYTFTPGASITWNEGCSGNSTLPEGNYAPSDPWENLIGCPMNGEWCIIFIDNLGLDDGTITQAGLKFNNEFTIETWEYITEIEEFRWSADGFNSDGEEASDVLDSPGRHPYVFTVVDEFGCEYDTTVYVTVRDYLHPICCTMPDAYAGETDMICGNTYTLQATLTAGNTGTWTMVSGPGQATFGQPASPNSTVRVNGWGRYKFMWKEQFGGIEGCWDSATVVIDFWPVPNTAITYTPIKCYGNYTEINYVGNMDDEAVYTWDFMDGYLMNTPESPRGPYIVRWDESGAHNISLQVSDNGCHSPDTLVTIFQPTLLRHSLTTTNDPCYESCNGSAEATVQGGTLPYSYSWTSPTNVITGLCARPYSLTITDNNGCTTGEDFVITHPPKIIITETEVTDLNCYNSNDGTITVLATGGTGTLRYVWSDIGSSSIYERINLAAGNYSLDIIDDNNCVLTSEYTITQPEEFLLNLPQDTAVCEGTVIEITAPTIGGTLPYTYYCTRIVGGVEGGEFIATFPMHEMPSVTTTYKIYAKDAHNCISNVRFMTITVSQRMEISQLIVKDNRCYQSCDGQAQVVLRGGIAPFDYSWHEDGPIAENLCPGIYPLTITDVLGCNVSTIIEISEPLELEYSILSEPASCYGASDGSVTILVQGGVEPYTYLWPDGTTANTLTTSAGTYPVTVKDANNCRIIKPLEITEPSRIYVAPLSDRSICRGQSTTLSGHVSGGVSPFDFHWRSSNGDTYNHNNWIVSPQDTATYTLEVTDYNGCSSSPLTVSVNIYPDVNILSVVREEPGRIVCPGEEVKVRVDVTGGNGGPYYIKLSGGEITGPYFSVWPEKTTKYYIEASDMCGANIAHDSLTIEVRPVISGEFTSNIVKGCVPLTVEFKEESGRIHDNYLWRFGNNDYLRTPSPVYEYKEPGIYTVSLEVMDDYGCSHVKTIEDMITVYPKPNSMFEVDNSYTSALKSNITFINHTTGALNYYWFFGDGEGSVNVNPNHTYRDMGEYEVTLISESEYLCRDTVRRSIRVDNDFTFYMPTAFTPNGDGSNDCIRPCGNGISKNNYRFIVQDRWGNVVFETDKYDSDASCSSCSDGAWDGKMKGSASKDRNYLPNGAYTWYCEFEDWNGIRYAREGVVTLVR